MFSSLYPLFLQWTIISPISNELEEDPEKRVLPS